MTVQLSHGLTERISCLEGVQQHAESLRLDDGPLEPEQDASVVFAVQRFLPHDPI